MAMYLGNPTGAWGMKALPDASPGWQSEVGRNTKATALVGGGTAAARAVTPRRTYGLSWPLASATEADLILGFLTGIWGPGPYAILDPSWTNLLPLDSSLFGSRRGVLTGWAATAGTLTYSSVTASALGSGGSAIWAGAGSGSQAGDGVIVSGAVESVATVSVPYVATELFQVRVYAKTVSGTASLTARVSGRNAAQTIHTDVAGTPVALNSSSWQPVTAVASAGFAAGAQFVNLTLVCNTAAAPNILLSNPQIQTGTLTSWVSGWGVPRCVVIDDPMTSVTVAGWRDVGLTLAEC